jgi:hypothetical protein
MRDEFKTGARNNKIKEGGIVDHQQDIEDHQVMDESIDHGRHDQHH